VSYWESGKRVPGLDDLIELSRALEQDVFMFLPPSEERQPVAAVLRAETQRLASDELGRAVDHLLADAEAMEIPEARIRVVAKQPAYAANELLERAGVDAPPIPVERLAALCGVLVLKRDFPDALSGLVLNLDDGALIGVNARHPTVRQRFTTAHELGHHLLEHRERFHIDVSEGHPPGHDYRSERAANEFAADLLMPRRLVMREFEREPSPPALAKRFDVSEIAMGYRLVDLGFR
jgi:Zn-dependent peptidase ImmA (M78 family)